jgi:hypothetical protein
MSGHRGEEVVSIQCVEDGIGACGHRRRSRDVAEERDLTEVASRRQLRNRRPVLGDLDLSLHHDVEAVSQVSLPNDHGAAIDAERNEARSQVLERSAGQRRKDWTDARI